MFTFRLFIEVSPGLVAVITADRPTYNQMNSIKQLYHNIILYEL